jgi:hypothetical protein
VKGGRGKNDTGGAGRLTAAGLSDYTNTVAVAVPTAPAAPSPVTVTASRRDDNRGRAPRTWANIADKTGCVIQRAPSATFTADVVIQVGAKVATFTTGNAAPGTP